MYFLLKYRSNSQYFWPQIWYNEVFEVFEVDDFLINASDSDKMWYSGVFEVGDYESRIEFLKNKITPIDFKEYSL